MAHAPYCLAIASFPSSHAKLARQAVPSLTLRTEILIPVNGERRNNRKNRYLEIGLISRIRPISRKLRSKLPNIAVAPLRMCG
jgi:hypothetical protein